MEISIKWNICRVCLEEESKQNKGLNGDKQMRNIFNEDRRLARHIYEFSGIVMKPNDSLPDKICQKCLTIVKSAVNFRKNCRISHAYLQSILQRTKSASGLFKSDRPPTEMNEEYEEEMTLVENATPNEDEGAKQLKRHLRVIQPRKKKPKNIDKPNTEVVISEDANNPYEHHDCDYSVEFEDFTEHSEEMEGQIVEENRYEEEIGGDNNNQLCKDPMDQNSKTPGLHELDMDIGFKKVALRENEYEENVDNLDETATEDLKQDIEEFCYVIKDVENRNDDEPTKNKENFEEKAEYKKTSVMGEDNFEYLTIEEDGNIKHSLILCFEQKISDNQAQVSSTVETNDEIELHEQDSSSSNITNDLVETETEEYIADEYIHDDDSSAQDVNVPAINAMQEESRKMKGLKNISVRSTSVVLARHNIKQLVSSRVAARRVGNSYQLHVCACNICGNRFNNRQLLNNHMKVHRQEKNHECELCFKRFITACNLQAHMRIHTGEKPFECQYCGRRFNDRSSNLRHERTHTNEKPFQCTNCGKSFTLATTLQNHTKVHTGERLYRCEPCGKSFKLPHHLKMHKNTTLHKAVEHLALIEN